MPKKQPFTQLCQQLASPMVRPSRADLHIHTTASDGSYRPEEVVELARRAGLAAIALTDHDTLAGIAVAREALASQCLLGKTSPSLEIITGVEITCILGNRELHLLGLFVDENNASLNAALECICQRRKERYLAMIERLRTVGISLQEEPLPTGAVGRRHLAELLVRQRKVSTLREAFQRYLGDGGPADVPNRALPAAEAITLVRQAGGVAAWAHPPYDCQQETLVELCKLGLGAVEANFPEIRPAHRRRLQEWAEILGLAVTAGSDCHGPGAAHRAIGACSINDEQLQHLRTQGQRISNRPSQG